MGKKSFKPPTRIWVIKWMVVLFMFFWPGLWVISITPLIAVINHSQPLLTTERGVYNVNRGWDCSWLFPF
jgi:hypothetical protein